jgi:hypothetical protein
MVIRQRGLHQLVEDFVTNAELGKANRNSPASMTKTCLLPKINGKYVTLSR